MTQIDSLARTLARLDWLEQPRAHRAAQRSFATIDDPGRLLAEIAADDPRRTEHDRSSEKTTHFKWFVAEDPDDRFSLWLNTYKPSTHRRTGHAEVAHNHRFWFTSLVLSGGFTHATFTADGPTLTLSNEITLRAGDSFIVDPAEIHALRDLQDETVTLIVQSRPVRAFSDVYEGGAVTRYHDLPSSRQALNEQLATVPAFPRTGRNHHPA